MPFIMANGIDIWMERTGAGAPLLALTGTGVDLRKPPSILQSPLGRAFDLVSYDQRGLGRSAKPTGPYAMADYAADAAGVIDAIGWERAHVVGISFGGMVAQELAIRYPERVDRLVLCCTTAGGAGGGSYPQHELHHLSPGEKVRHMLGVADVRRDAAWQAVNGALVAQLVRAAEDDAFLDEPGTREGRREQIDARGRHDCWGRLHAIRAPTLVCGAIHDGQATPDAVIRLAARIPGAVLRWFDGGHMFLGQDASAFPCIAEFLATGVAPETPYVAPTVGEHPFHPEPETIQA